jgi:hypothetical protein
MELINKVAQSGIITLDLEHFFPVEKPFAMDISQWLFRGLLLKEKEFRDQLKQYDFNAMDSAVAAVYCSTDAIIPQWAYMLVANYLTAAGKDFYFGTVSDVENEILIQNIRSLNTEDFIDQKIVVKGCGTRALPDKAYLEISKKLLPVVKSLMFGEPCSTVPVYKKK